MSHILLRLNGIELAQFPDTDLTITRTNPFFNDGTEVESHPFSVPIEGNRVHFQNADVIESDATIHPVRNGILEAIVDGIPVISGKCGSIEDQELKDRVSIKLESAVKTLDEYLENVRCRDVAMKDEIQIGETIGNLTLSLTANLNLILVGKPIISRPQDAYLTKNVMEQTLFSESIAPTYVPLTLQLPALGFSKPSVYKTRIDKGEVGPIDSHRFDSFGDVGVEPDEQYRTSFINIDKPYPDAKYCNSRVSYMHYLEKGGESTDEVDVSTTKIDEYSKYNPYLMLEADRPASGMCFYVLYFLDCLFHTFAEDGIHYDNSDLLKVDDLRRLAFFTTHCKFDTKPRVHPEMGNIIHLGSLDSINSWLHSRNIDTTLQVDSSNRTEHLNSLTIDDKVYVANGGSIFVFRKKGDSRVYNCTITDIKYVLSDVKNFVVTADVMDMFANSQNFPDADAKEIIDNMWGAFGVRFYLDPQTRIVKPRFIRDILRDQSEPILFPCTVVEAVKQTEYITGVRMAYSSTSDEQQRKDNITLGLRDYDTTYDYQDYSNLDATLNYNQILAQLHDSNMTCYVDLMTGNRFRVKIDGDAETDEVEDFKKRKNLHPVFFEVGQLSCVEVGDCSEENKDYIIEITNSFQPVVFNDLNYREESKSVSAEVFTFKDPMSGLQRTVRLGTSGPKKQVLSPFISEDMWHENITRRLLYPMGTEHVQFKLVAEIKTKEAFDPTSSDDGDSPLQHADWGLAIAVMRGGGSDSHIDYYDFNYDGFGSAKYRTVAGSDYSMSLDSIDCYAQTYDYNGDIPGTDGGADDYHGPYDTRYDGTYTRMQASNMIVTIWINSNADLLSLTRKVSGAAVLAAGWEEGRGADFCTVISSSHCLTDADGQKREFLMTHIADDGTILTPAEFTQYLSRLEEVAASTNRSIKALDALSDLNEAHRLGVGRRLIIQQFDDVSEANQYHSPWADFYGEILHQFHAIYYGSALSGDVRCPQPYIAEHFSLKLRSYVNAPYDIYDKDGNLLVPTGAPLCVSDPAIRNRGLFDTFFSEYAHWLLNRKLVKLTILCEVAALLDIQWHRRYRFGDYVGFINKLTSHITAANGLETVEVELFI